MKKVLSICIICLTLLLVTSCGKKEVTISEDIKDVREMVVVVNNTEFNGHPTYKDIIDAGFKPNHADLKESYDAGAFFGCEFTASGNNIYADFINSSDKSMATDSIPVSAIFIYSDSKTKYLLPCNITESSLEEDIKSAYGKPDKTDEEKNTITYSNKDGSSVTFCFTVGGLISYFSFNY